MVTIPHQPSSRLPSSLPFCSFFLHALTPGHAAKGLFGFAEGFVFVHLTSLLIRRLFCRSHLFYSRLLIRGARVLHIGGGVRSDCFLVYSTQQCSL